MLDVKYKPDRGFDVPDSIFDNGLLAEETGWRLKTPLQEGIGACLSVGSRYLARVFH